MNILGIQLTLEDFKEYVKGYNFGKLPPDRLVIHHTWKPRIDDWNGKTTLKGLKSYYEGKGWNAGPHLFIAEDGIWLFTPMYDVGIHAASGNAGYKFGRLQWYSLGIEVVGDYDTKEWTGKTKQNALGAIKILKDHLKIDNEKVFFHRDFSNKTCPGAAIQKAWLFQELEMFGKPAPVVNDNVSPWAKDGWEWAQGLSLDNSIHPQKQVTAEWVFAIMKKLADIGTFKQK